MNYFHGVQQEKLQSALDQALVSKLDGMRELMGADGSWWELNIVEHSWTVGKAILLLWRSVFWSLESLDMAVPAPYFLRLRWRPGRDLSKVAAAGGQISRTWLRRRRPWSSPRSRMGSGHMWTLSCVLNELSLRRMQEISEISVIWCDMMWYDVIWCDMICLVWF